MPAVADASTRASAKRHAKRVQARTAADDSCFSQHTWGTAGAITQACVARDGNLASLLTQSSNQLGDDGGEGYVLCEGTAMRAWEAGTYGEGGLGPATVSQPNGAGTLPLLIVRTTSDKVARISQRYALDPAGRSITITMTVKNLTAQDRTFGVIRSADVDTDGKGSDDVLALTPDSAIMLGNATAAVSLTSPSATSGNWAHAPVAQGFSTWNATGKSSCALPAAPATLPTGVGDWVLRVRSTMGETTGFASRTQSFRYGVM
ncbi:MAG TPA: hypothetical protein VF533_25715 [Solirubrobacteraceae bacterium]